MARPAKAVSTKTGEITKEEKKARMKTEEKLRGTAKRILPPKHLTDEQKKIFKYIVQELKASDILGKLDVYVLSTAAIAIDRMAAMEQMVNEDKGLLRDAKFMAAKDKYTKDFFRCCSELSLSPQARAKFAVTNYNAEKECKNPLLEALEL